MKIQLKLIIRIVTVHKKNVGVREKQPLLCNGEGETSFILPLGWGTINDIICLMQWTKVVMWNLATKKFKLIPPGYAESITPYCVLLVTYQGFGYDHATNDYKVFQYLSFFPRRSDVPVLQSWKNMSLRPLWEIYSLRSNSFEET